MYAIRVASERASARLCVTCIAVKPSSLWSLFSSFIALILSRGSSALRINAIKLLKGLHRELGFTAIHVTHNLAEALSLATRIAYMEKGRLIGVYESREFLETKHATPYLEEYRALKQFLE